MLMNRANFVFIAIGLIVSVILTNITSAETKTFIKEYTYRASDADSKLSCRAIALEQVKKLLLEEIGSYIISETQVINSQLTKEQITALTAGVVKTEIISETWNGNKYYLKAKIVADPTEVSKSVQRLSRDKQMSKELEDAQKQVNDGLKEIERLKKELATTKDNKQNQIEYAKSINELSANEWREKGYTLERENNPTEAIYAWSRVVELDPGHAPAYYRRALNYDSIGNYRQAINDFEKVLDIEPGNRDVYSWRANSYRELGDYEKAIGDYDKAIMMSSSKKNMYYGSRAFCYYKLKNYTLAIRDFSTEIELLEKSTKEYENRSPDSVASDEFWDKMFAGFVPSSKEQAETDKAVLGEDYYNRGIVYGVIKNYPRELSDLKSAAILGNESAQKILIQHRISW